MISLNDYLYNGDTVIKILHNYSRDLREDARKTGNPIDLAHCDFLVQMSELLEHNDFLTSQSQRMREFYKHMTETYPDLAFTFKGRIKSLIRAESKFNGQIVSFVHDYYKEYGRFPTDTEIKERLSATKDLIAYRIIISMPKCHVKDEEERKEKEMACLYDIANRLPSFLSKRGFDAQVAKSELGNSNNISLQGTNNSSMLASDVAPFYKDYIAHTSPSGYKSLHITFFDNISLSYIEVQIRTYDMDNYAEIGPANHMGYESRQADARGSHSEIPSGQCMYYDEALERVAKLRNLELSELDVNMFAAINNSLINDGCGLFRGRLILPYEHLSRFQNDIID